MSVYRRTIQGRMDAFNNQSALSQTQRKLLQHIDGKTHFLRLQSTLGPHICSDKGISELLQMGLVQSMEDESDDQDDSDLKAVVHDLRHRPTEPATLRPSFGFTQSSGLDMLTRSPKKKTKLLDDAKDLMADFVLAHLPEHAFSVLKEIEEIASVEMLRGSLNAYEMLVQLTGTSGKKHVRELRSIAMRALYTE